MNLLEEEKACSGVERSPQERRNILRGQRLKGEGAWGPGMPRQVVSVNHRLVTC